MKNLPDAPLQSRLLALPTNIVAGWKALPGKTLQHITNIHKLYNMRARIVLKSS